MKLTISNVGCVALLCLASCLGTEGYRRDLFAPRAIKSETRGSYYCYYDYQRYQYDTNEQINHYGSLYNCDYSTARSRYYTYVVLTLSNIQVNCAEGDIELWDKDDNYWSYCRNGSPSTYTQNFVNRVDIGRQGRVSFFASIRFTDQVGPVSPSSTYQPGTNPSSSYQPGTFPPITNAPVTNPPSSGSCGVQVFKPDESDLRIVGGIFARDHSWPWMAAFKENGYFFCGGTLINDQWILTAAHCLSDLTNLASLKVTLGENNVNTAPNGLGAAKWIIHEQYDAYNTVNDIALVKLANKVTFTSNISPVCLPNGRSPVIGTIGMVTGWGTTQADGNGQVSPQLKQVAVPINPASVCGYGALPVTQICAGVLTTGAEKDSCQGDSGGPFVMKDKSTSAYYIAGIVSYGESCGGRGAYTNVKEFESWIARTISANP